MKLKELIEQLQEIDSVGPEAEVLIKGEPGAGYMEIDRVDVCRISFREDVVVLFPEGE